MAYHTDANGKNFEYNAAWGNGYRYQIVKAEDGEFLAYNVYKSESPLSRGYDREQVLIDATKEIVRLARV